MVCVSGRGRARTRKDATSADESPPALGGIVSGFIAFATRRQAQYKGPKARYGKARQSPAKNAKGGSSPELRQA